MNTTIRGHNLRVTVVMALLAVVLLVAVVLLRLPSSPLSEGRAVLGEALSGRAG